MPPRNRTWRSPPRMWDGLKHKVRALRQEATPAEALLWRALRGGKLAGLPFRRQHPLGRYIADFFCTSRGVVIELDGPIHHEQVAEDGRRQLDLERMGLMVLRFTNDRVLGHLEIALREIESACLSRPLSKVACRKSQDSEHNSDEG